MVSGGGGGRWIGNLERLESRVVLSTSTWTGGNSATDVNWSDAANWRVDTAPVAGNDLVFPTGVTGTALTNTNDITASTSFNSLSIQNSGYTITGNAVDMDTIDSSQTTGSSSLGLADNFGTSAGSVTVDQRAGDPRDGRGALRVGRADQAGLGRARPDGRQHVHRDHDGQRRHAARGRPDGTVGAVAVSTDATLGGTGTVGSITTTGAIVSPGDSTTGILTDTGALTLDSNSAFDATINGSTAGSTATDYSQLQVAGAINLANATLNVTLSSAFTPTANETFTIINNTGTSAITGTFAGLPEQATVTVSGQQFKISYVGGTGGNSVVLTAVAGPHGHVDRGRRRDERQLVRHGQLAGAAPSRPPGLTWSSPPG